MAFGYNTYGGYQQPAYNPYNNSMMGQQPFQQQMNAPQTPMQQPVQQPNGAIWVQGEAGAKSYLVGAGNTVILWDSEKLNSEKPVIYIKTADNQGVPSMQAFELTPLNANAAQSNAEYITREEFDAIKEQVNELVVKERERQERYEKKRNRKSGEEVNNG